MANKYTRWAPTAYVPLPIDYYQSALAYKEQKTAAALEKINAIIAGYGAIDPLSPDSQALYDEATTKLRTDLGAIVKQDLTTPAANRAVNKVLSDPTIVDSYDKVMTDALYGAEAKKTLNEYLKKNPKVNAAEYLSRFDRLGIEEGKSANFDPNRFRNMPALADYYDINKRIEEGIARLHSDSTAYKKIVEPYLVEGKETYLSRQKVREYVISQIQGDPLVKEQMARNLRYSGYTADHYDIDNGLIKLGEHYRGEFQANQESLQSELATLYGNKTPKELEALRADDKSDAGKAFRKSEKSILAGIEGLTQYMKPNSDPNAPAEFLDPTEMAEKVERDQLKYGFDQFAWHEGSTGYDYSQDHMARLRASLSFNNAKRLKELSMQQMLDFLKPTSVTYDGREQQAVTPDKWNKYLSNNVEGLSNVILDNNGAFKLENYKDKLKYAGDGFYAPGDIRELTAAATKETLTPPPGFELVSSGGTTPYSQGKSVITFKRIGSKPLVKGYRKLKPEDYRQLYDKGKAEIKEYLSVNSPNVDYNLEDDAGMKNAMQAIVAFNQETESMYGPIYTNLLSGTKTAKTTVRNNLNNSAIYAIDDDGQLSRIEKDGDAKDEIRKELDNPNSQVSMRPVSRINKAFRVVSVGNKNYYIEATPLMQSFAAPANKLITAMIGKGEPVRDIEGDLYLKFMGNAGKFNSLKIEGGGTPQAQADYAAKYEQNVQKVMSEGSVTREEAETQIKKQTQFSGNAVKIKLGPKGYERYVELDVPILKHKTKATTDAYGQPVPSKDVYYAWGDVGNFKVRSGLDVINNVMNNLTDIRQNPESALEAAPLLRAVTRENMILEDDELP